MKIVDANILLYAHNSASPFHAKAREWLEQNLADRSDPVAIPAQVALTFVRLVSNPKAVPHPISYEVACNTVQSWFEAGAVLLETEAEDFEQMGKLMAGTYAGANLLVDAHLAALAIRKRATIYSNDRDFLRFPGVKVKNPVEP